MTWPDDPTMLVLLGVVAGEQLVPTEDGDVAMTVPGVGTVPNNRDALEHLEAVGWIEIHAGGVRATDKGEWAAARWVEKRCKVRGVSFGPGVRFAGNRE